MKYKLSKLINRLDRKGLLEPLIFCIGLIIFLIPSLWIMSDPNISTTHKLLYILIVLAVWKK